MLSDGTHEYPILFPSHIDHSYMSSCFCHVKSITPVSAGYVCIIDNRFSVFGGSLTLGLDSRDSDVAILNRMLTT